MFTYVSNTEDALHCTQASLMMLVESLSGTALTMREAEAATGFHPERETWPYRMIEWLAESGYEVVHIDALDANAMAEDAIAELRRSGLDEKTIDYFCSITDFAAEGARIRRAIEHGAKYVAEVPRVEEMRAWRTDGWHILISLNASALRTGETEEFDGHMVYCTSVNETSVEIQDPGPPPLMNFEVSMGRLRTALRSPVETSGTITYVRQAGLTGGGPRGVSSYVAT